MSLDAPNMEKREEVKKMFQELLNENTEYHECKKRVIVIGDINARVGDRVM